MFSLLIYTQYIFNDTLYNGYNNAYNFLGGKIMNNKKDKKIKQALLNPLNIFSFIFGIDLPDSTLFYSDSIFNIFLSIFDIIFPYDKYNKYIDKIFYMNNISEKDMEKIVSKNNKIVIFSNLLNMIKDNLYNFQYLVCVKSKSNKDVKEFKFNFNRLIKNIGLDPRTLFIEISSDMISYNKKAVYDICEFICHSINNCMKALVSEDTNCNIDEGIDFYMKKNDVNTLRKNVNSLDNETIPKLKKTEKSLYKDFDYQSRLIEYKNAVTEFIRDINNVTPSQLSSIDIIFNTTTKQIKINDRFKKQSIYFNEKPRAVNNTQYIMRFISYIGEWIVSNLDKISDVYSKMDDYNEFTKYDRKIKHAENIIILYCSLVSKMIKRKNCKKEIIYLTEVQSYIQYNGHKEKKISNKINNINDQSEVLSIRLKRLSRSDQDISIDTLLKVSYLLSTNDLNCYDKIPFKSGYKFSNKEDTLYLVKQLGKKISNYTSKHKVSKLFKCFIESNPLITSKLKNINSDRFLVLGLYALNYLAFVSNDKNIKRVVNNIL